MKLSLDTSVSYAKLCKRSGGSVLYGNGYNSLNEFSFEKIWEESKANLTFLVDVMNALYGEEKSIEDIRQDLLVRYSFFFSSLSKYHNTLCLSNICISIVSSFSWDHCKSQEKIKTMLIQYFGGTNTDYYGIFDIG